MDGKTALRQARAEANWTQSDLAFVLGVSLRTVQRWEAGTGSPPIEHAWILELLLGVRARVWTSADALNRAGDRAHKIDHRLFSETSS